MSFTTFFKKPYELLERTMKNHLSSNSKILDIGCGTGAVEDIVDKYFSDCSIRCLDSDKGSLGVISGKDYSSNIKLVDSSFFKYVLDHYNNSLRLFDTVVSNASLHEIGKVSENKDFFLKSFLRTCYDLLEPDGKLVVGDYFYPSTVGDESVIKYKAHQLSEIGHADEGDCFFNPETVKKLASNYFKVLSYDNIRAVKEIDRRYYLFVLEKV